MANEEQTQAEMDAQAEGPRRKTLERILIALAVLVGVGYAALQLGWMFRWLP
jgi:hypothetical protein